MDDVFTGDDPDESNQHWCDAEAVHDARRDLAGGGHPSHLGAVHPGDLDDVGAGPGVRGGPTGVAAAREVLPARTQVPASRQRAASSTA